ncbi:MAG: NlpC/P60 family protein [Eubacterium ramulus]
MISYASQFLGNPYVWGGTSLTNGGLFGFVIGVYAHYGISLPHSSSALRSVRTWQ